MAADKLRQSSVEELRAKERDLRETLARLQMKRHARRLEKTSELRVAKKDLARVLTALNEKASAGAQGRGAN